MKPTERQLMAGRELGENLVRLLVLVQPEVPHAAPYPREEKPKPPVPIKPTEEKLVVSPREAARMLSISARTLWGLTAPRGPLPAVHFGRLVRYSVDDLRGAIETLKVRKVKSEKEPENEDRTS